MATFMMFGKYSLEALKEVSAERSEQAIALVETYGGEILAGYALLGQHDLVLIVELPGTEEAVKTSVALARLLGIAFTTSPAVNMQDFDTIVEEV
jgi:uncharacterized protein with GYD domain